MYQIKNNRKHLKRLVIQLLSQLHQHTKGHVTEQCLPNLLSDHFRPKLRQGPRPLSYSISGTLQGTVTNYSSLERA
jgi:hypothetical protein